MICKNCTSALFNERMSKDPDDKPYRDVRRKQVITHHLHCEGNCDCLHYGFLEIAGKPAKPLYHGGIGGFQPYDILTPPAQSGYLRPQAAIEQADLKQSNLHVLTFKKTYRPDRVYATTAIHLARNHAAGITNWMSVTNGSQRFASHGAVYRVEPVGELAPDLGTELEHCCLMEHSDTDWCAFSAPKFMVVEVIEPCVEAQDDKLMIASLGRAYGKWRDMNGGDWWDGTRSSRIS